MVSAPSSNSGLYGRNSRKFFSLPGIFNQIGIVTKPVILLPFKAGYFNGFSRGIIPSRPLLAFLVFLVEMGLMSSVMLFGYRYQAVKGLRNYLPKWEIALILAAFPLSCITAAIIMIANYNHVRETVENMVNTYTCFTRELAEIEGIIAYELEPLSITGKH